MIPQSPHEGQTSRREAGRIRGNETKQRNKRAKELAEFNAKHFPGGTVPTLGVNSLQRAAEILNGWAEAFPELLACVASHPALFKEIDSLEWHVLDAMVKADRAAKGVRS